MVERMFDWLEGLAAEDRSSWSAPARSARLLELLRARERLEAETLRCLGEWDAARAWADHGAFTPQAWLVQQAPVTKSEATRLMRTARLARDHERTSKLLSTGDVSTSHVEVMARAARHREECFAEHEDALLDAATALPPDSFRHVARRWRCLADDALADSDAFNAFEARRLHCSATFRGTVVVDGELDAEGGATVIAALEVLASPDPVNGSDLPDRWRNAALTPSSISRSSRSREGRRAPAVHVQRMSSWTPTRLPDDRQRISSQHDASSRVSAPYPEVSSSGCAATPQSDESSAAGTR